MPEAGLVKWYNSSFPNWCREFDSPIPHMEVVETDVSRDALKDRAKAVAREMSEIVSASRYYMGHDKWNDELLKKLGDRVGGLDEDEVCSLVKNEMVGGDVRLINAILLAGTSAVPDVIDNESKLRHLACKVAKENWFSLVDLGTINRGWENVDVLASLYQVLSEDVDSNNAPILSAISRLASTELLHIETVGAEINQLIESGDEQTLEYKLEWFKLAIKCFDWSGDEVKGVTRVIEGLLSGPYLGASKKVQKIVNLSVQDMLMDELALNSIDTQVPKVRDGHPILEIMLNGPRRIGFRDADIWKIHQEWARDDEELYAEGGLVKYQTEQIVSNSTAMIALEAKHPGLPAKLIREYRLLDMVPAMIGDAAKFINSVEAGDIKEYWENDLVGRGVEGKKGWYLNYALLHQQPHLAELDPSRCIRNHVGPVLKTYDFEGEFDESQNLSLSEFNQWARDFAMRMLVVRHCAFPEGDPLGDMSSELLVKILKEHPLRFMGDEAPNTLVMVLCGDVTRIIIEDKLGGKKGGEIPSRAERVFEELSFNNIHARSLIGAWQQSAPQTMHSEVFDRNLGSMVNLDLVHRGSSRDLYDNFRIKCFGRYNRQTLINQYRERDNTSMRFGIAIYPEHDGNGAFYSQSSVLEELRSNLGYLTESRGSKVGLRIIEGGNFTAIARTILQVAKRYGISEERRFAFGIAGGHGTETSLRFGRNFSGILTVDHFRNEVDGGALAHVKERRHLGPALEKIIHLFDPEGSGVLISCSTGVPRGPAHEIAKSVGEEFVVAAPDKPTGIKGIDLAISDRGGGMLSPRFDDVDTKYHQTGEGYQTF